MSSDGKVIKAAAKLVKAANKFADDQLPGRLAGIVKLHSGLAVGAAFVPIPGADVAAAAANIWTMYGRINSELNMPFSENVIKSIAGGVATNLGAYFAGTLVIGGVFKLLPGLGTVAGIGVVGATVYGVTITSGIIYMHALAELLEAKAGEAISEADLKAATDNALRNKTFVKETLEEAKRGYQPGASK